MENQHRRRETLGGVPSGLAHLARVVVLRVQQQTEFRQELWPVLELSLGGDSGDEDACHTHRGRSLRYAGLRRRLAAHRPLNMSE